MRTTLLPVNNLLSPQSVKLGRLVQNTKSPHQEFLDPFDDRPAESEVNVNSQENFQEIQNYSERSKLRCYFSNLLSISCKLQNTGVATITALQHTTYNLQNSRTWFDAACARPNTRTWLENAVDEGNDIYLVVGFRTLINAKLAKSTTSVTLGGSGIEVPTMASLAGPGVAGTRDVEYGQKCVFDAPGEQIFAVEYRKVKHKWYSSRKTSDLPLERNTRWKVYWDWRGPGGEDGRTEEEEEDILEASITDTSDTEIDDEDISDDVTS